MKFDESSHRSIRWIFTRTTILSIIFCVHARADEATKQRFLKEYPSASQELMRRFENAACTIEQVLPQNKGTIVIEYRKSGSFEKAEIESKVMLKGQLSETTLVILKSPDEATTLYRTKGSPFVDTFDQFSSRIARAIYDEFRKSRSLGSAWKLYETRLSYSSWLKQVNRTFSSRCGEYVYSIWGGEIDVLTRWMRAPDIELIDANPVPDRPGIIEIRFRRTRTKQVRDSVARLNTNNHWAVVSFMTPIQNTGSDAGFEVHYGDPIDGVAWPERIDYLNGATVTLKDWSFGPTPPSEFRPSHYGLPDRRRIWFEPRNWLAVSSIVAVVALTSMIVVIRAWRRRIRKRQEMRSLEPITESESA